MTIKQKTLIFSAAFFIASITFYSVEATSNSVFTPTSVENEKIADLEYYSQKNFQLSNEDPRSKIPQNLLNELEAPKNI